jgi:hypothetical protein
MAIRKAQIQITTQVDSSAAQKAAVDIEALSTASKNAAKEIDSISQSADAAMAALQNLSIPEIDIAEIKPQIDESSINAAIKELEKLDAKIKSSSQVEITPDVDTAQIQSAIAEIQKLDAKIKSSDDTKPRIQVDASQIRSAVAEIAKLQTSVQKSDQKIIRPKTDASQVKAATRETEKLNTSLKSVDAQKIRPEVDATSINRAEAALASFGQRAQTAQSGARNVGSVAAQAGFQVQDFAVQVGAGTSALTAFAQQAPQLLGVFGPTGAIAGALVAVGAVAAKIFIGMAADAKEAGEAAEEMAERMKEAFAAAGEKEAKQAISTFEHLTELTNILRESEISLTEAKYKRAASEATLLKSQQSLTEAAIDYLDKTGQIQNAEEALAESRRQTAEAQKEAAISDIENAVQIERDRYENIRAQKRDVQEEVLQSQARINELQAEQQRLTQELNRQRRFDEGMVEAGVKDEGFESAAAQKAAAQLANIEKQIASLLSFVEAAPSKINDLTAAAYEQGAKIDAAVENAKTEIDRIESEFALNEQAATLREAATGITQSVSEITTAIGSFQPITEAQTQAKDRIMQAVADGEITAQEQLTISSNLQLLLAQMRTGQEGITSVLRELLANQTSLTSKMQAANNEIGQLRSKINSLVIPVR